MTTYGSIDVARATQKSTSRSTTRYAISNASAQENRHSSKAKYVACLPVKSLSRSPTSHPTKPCAKQQGVANILIFTKKLQLGVLFKRRNRKNFKYRLLKLKKLFVCFFLNKIRSSEKAHNPCHKPSFQSMGQSTATVRSSLMMNTKGAPGTYNIHI